MGQAFRRATGGRIGSSSSKLVSRTPPPPPPPPQTVPFPTPDDTGSGENILEDRDPQYDSMLTHMAGTIRSKPGGKPEMGEASVVENYNRPLPKVRNTTTESTRYEDKPAPPGTLNVAQLRQIIILYQTNDPPITVPQLAQRFRIDAAQVQCILNSVSLPPLDAVAASNKENES